MPSLKHVSLPSGRVWMAILIPTIIAIVLVVGILRPSPPRQAQPPVTPTSPSSSQPTPQLPIATEPEETVADVEIGGLAGALYQFEEIVNLPPSPQRDAHLKAISTPTGYESLVVSGTVPDSPADEHAKGITFLALRSETDVIQAEPFDEKSVSVASEIRLQVSRDGDPIQTITVKRLTTWSKINGVWKFEGEQF